MSRQLVILPVDFSGPWSMGLSCPIRVSPTGFNPATALAVITASYTGTLPESAKTVDLQPGETIDLGLSRVGLRKARGEAPAPAPVLTVLPSAPAPEPPVTAAAPVPTFFEVIPAPEPKPEPRSIFRRALGFFRK